MPNYPPTSERSWRSITAQGIVGTLPPQRSGEVKLSPPQIPLVEIIAQHGHGGFPHASLAWTPRAGKGNQSPLNSSALYSMTTWTMTRSPTAGNRLMGSPSMTTDSKTGPEKVEFGDFDPDGLLNRDEYMLGTDPSSADTDGDGLSDGDEVHSFRTDPMRSDTKSELGL